MERKKIIKEKRNIIEALFKLDETTLLQAMKTLLSNHYEQVISTEKYLIAIGDIPIALIAHLDTVFPSQPTEIYYDKEKNVLWSPDGLGADDRAGVLAIKEIILRNDFRPTIIFTTEEEKWGGGATALVEDYPNPPVDLKYIIELDRQGENDCVFYDCANKEFKEYIEGFGFKTKSGTFSDISVICPSWGIAGVNLSIGYFNEHSYAEYLNIDYMFNTINKVLNMLKKAESSPYFKYIEFWEIEGNIERDEEGKIYSLYSLDEIKALWDPDYGVPLDEWISYFAL